jgi:hypothetical protein
MAKRQRRKGGVSLSDRRVCRRWKRTRTPSVARCSSKHSIKESQCTCGRELQSPSASGIRYLACDIMKRTSEKQEMQKAGQHIHTDHGTLEAAPATNCVRPSAPRFSHWFDAHNLSTRCIQLPGPSPPFRVAFFVPQPRHAECHWCEATGFVHHCRFQPVSSRGYPNPPALFFPHLDTHSQAAKVIVNTTIS